LEIANINAPGQIVVAGTAECIDAFISTQTAMKVRELSVSAPFHCTLMQPAAEKLAADLDRTEIRSPAFPIIANYSAQATTDPETIRQNLKLQVCGQVRWVESCQNAIEVFTP